jgi:hypothetical protein
MMCINKKNISLKAQKNYLENEAKSSEPQISFFLEKAIKKFTPKLFLGTLRILIYPYAEDCELWEHLECHH